MSANLAGIATSIENGTRKLRAFVSISGRTADRRQVI
jgi:hypothetical protein